MSFAIDLSEHGAELKKAYESVISSDPETTWTIFGYDGSSNALKPLASGSGGLDEFVEEFDDAKIEYGLVRVEFNHINKIVLVGWVGENVSSRQRLVFNAHMASVAKRFAGHHIQITARSSDELTSEIIMERVSAAAGSKYASSTRPAPSTKPKYVQAKTGANEEDWDGTEAVEEKELKSSSGSEYKSSVREELERLRKKNLKAPAAKAPFAKEEKEEEDEAPIAKKVEAKAEATKAESEDEEEEKPAKRGIAGLDSGTSYKPVGKIDLKKIREEGKNSKFADARIEKIEPSYKPVGKIDIKAIREKARKEKEFKARNELKGASKEEESVKETPKSDSEDEKPPVIKREAPKAAPKETPKKEVEEEKPAFARKAEEKPVASKTEEPKSNNDDSDDEPRFTSLAERMKAFQNSVSSAKPKFEATKTPRPSARSTSGASTAARSDYGVGRSKQSAPAKQEKPASDSEEEEAPLSVAAQLAKARLGSSRSESKSEPVKKESSAQKEEDEEAPKASVSTFAARFAKKEPAKETPKETVKAPEPPKSPEPPKAPARKVPEPESPEPPKAPARKVPEPESPEPPKAPARKAAEPKAPKNDDLVAVVIEEYEAGDDDELPLLKDEKITVVNQVDENWWLGENSQGSVGMFPSMCVKLISGEVKEEPKAEPKEAEPQLPSRGARKQEAPSAKEDAAELAAVEAAEEEADEELDEDVKAIAKAVYDYEKDSNDEIGFAVDEKITVIEFSNDDWWLGRNAQGDIGLFPSAYVEIVE